MVVQAQKVLGGVTAGSVTKSTDDTPRAIIHPPPGVRAVIDKTAQFVSENGEEFESKIIANEKDNPKWSFLRDDDPYNAYYRFRIQEEREGRSKPSAKEAALAPLVKKKEEKKIEPPAPDRFIAKMPAMTTQDLDTIRLAALFVAKQGPSFASGLMGREEGNPTFGFMRPSHSLHPFFAALVEQYKRVLSPSADALKKLEEDRSSRQAILARVLHKLEYRKSVQAQADADAAEEDKERVAFAQIDWHDFVIVETIEYEDPLVDTPIAAGGEEGVLEDVAMEVEMEMDDGIVEQETLIQQPKAASGVKIVKDYKPRLGDTTAKSTAVETAICPQCQRPIPIDELEEHMRIELLDPRWREQKAAAIQNRGTSQLAGDDETAANLRRLAQRRTDVAGGSDPTSKLKQKEAIAWDGHSTSSARSRSLAQAAVTPAELAAHRAAVAAEGKIDTTIGPASARLPGHDKPELEGEPPAKRQRAK